MDAAVPGPYTLVASTVPAPGAPMDPVEQRLQSLEKASTQMQVILARIEERQVAHSALTEQMNSTMVKQISELREHVEPLREQSWRQRGMATVWGLIGGVLTTLAVSAIRFWK